MQVFNEEINNLIIFKLKRYLRRINDFDLLYTPEAAEDIFVEILSRKYYKLATTMMGWLNSMNIKFSNIDTLGDETSTTMNNTAKRKDTSNGEGNQEITGEDNQGYAGYDLSNQDGSFVKNTNKNSSTTTNQNTTDMSSESAQDIRTRRSDYIKYLEYLTRAVDEWGGDVVREVRNNIVRGVY